MEGLIELRKISTDTDMLTKLLVGKSFTMKAMHLLGEMEISTDLVSEDILTYE
jgi:hypothetical protein